MARSRKIQLTEYVASGPGLRVNRETGVLQGVKVLGQFSENNREYPANTRQAALKLYEGIKVNIDHPDIRRPEKAFENRPLASRFGVLKNVRQEQGDGPFADLHFNPKHPLAESILWWAEHEPSAIGLSHNAEGRVKTDPNTGRDIVEEITLVHSVDLVSDPATTKGLFEGKRPMEKKSVKAILEAIYKEPAQVKILREMEGELADAMDAAVAVAEPEITPEEQASAAFKAMVLAVLDDASLDKAGKLAKIKEILNAEEKLVGAPPTEEEPASEEAAAEEVPAAEAKQAKQAAGKILREMAQLKRQVRGQELCEEAGVTPSKVLRAALRGAKSDAEMRALIEEARILSHGQSQGVKPRSGRPIPEGKANGIPEKVEELAGWLRN